MKRCFAHPYQSHSIHSGQQLLCIIVSRILVPHIFKETTFLRDAISNTHTHTRIFERKGKALELLEKG